MDERKLRAIDQRGAMLKASIRVGLNGYLVDQVSIRGRYLVEREASILLHTSRVG